ncbi:matrixin family metalloprotease, partial [Methanococcoides seepicolus]|nr:matrixin family metalloprotease [Methanococcoides seepicolus]
MRKAIFLGILGILIVSMIGLVNATPVNKQLSLQELTEDATIILIGNVENVKSEWNEDETQIFTNITISVGDVIKGDVPDQRITIRQMGGTVDNISLYIIDSPQFSLDEEVLLFMKPGFIPIVGMSQGKFSIETDAGTGDKMVKELGISLDDFVDLINNSMQGESNSLQSSVSYEMGVSSIGMLAAGSSPFKIFGPYPGATGIFVNELNSTDKPPFLHWDLREFSDCEVPWSISDNITDLNEDGNITDADRQLLLNEINTSFQAWENVKPCAIGFVEGNPRNVSNRAIRKDGFNVLDWSGPKDDVQAIAVGNGTPNSIIITPGPNGFINTTPAGDDKVSGNNIISGVNGVSETTKSGDDDQAIAVGNGTPNSIAITAGPNGFLETDPLGDDRFNVTNNWITSGNDGIVQTQANIAKTDFVAFTGVFYEKNGRIVESDIWFNSNLNWTVGIENETNGTFDVQVTATHEIGHFIGIAHSPVVNSTMDTSIWPADLSKRTLEASDENAANFLYTPDLGDAPDPDYPSLVHDGAGRTLNGIQLLSPALGAEHLFGYQPAGYAYEWLGKLVEKSNDKRECEAKVVNKDEHDDGVRFVNYTDVPREKFKVIVNVSTSGLGKARYKADDKLYLNAWVDWNGDGSWSQFEQIIEWEGGPGLNDVTKKGKLLNPETLWPEGTNSRELEFEVTVPLYTIPTYELEEPFYSRFRLDYDENVGEIKPEIDGTLNQDKGAAQFGEVEDYRHVRKIIPSLCWEKPCGTPVEQCDQETTFVLYESNATIVKTIHGYVYVDMEPDDVNGANETIITAGDIRLSEWHTNYEPNTKVMPEDLDNFDVVETVYSSPIKYVDVNDNQMYDLYDGVVYDLDGDGFVSVGDILQTDIPAVDVYSLEEFNAGEKIMDQGELGNAWDRVDNSHPAYLMALENTIGSGNASDLLKWVDADDSNDWSCEDKLYLIQPHNMTGSLGF